MSPVLCIADCNAASLAQVFSRFGLRMRMLAAGTDIPGSYFGESEAGLMGDELYVRADTPLHSAFHEGCHYICMDETRREQLNCDAGGDYDEENAVCYLQIVLADSVAELGRDRMLSDMDAWGYTFRLGSARAWFEQDADDARKWLLCEGLIDTHLRPTWLVRQSAAHVQRA